MVQAVVFDLFGTLTDPEVEAGRADFDAELAMLLGVAAGEWQALMRRTFTARATGAYGDARSVMTRLCEEAGISADVALLDRALELRFRHHLALTTLRPEAREVLTSIKARHLRTAVVSDCTPEITASWAALSLEGLIDAAVFSCSEGFRKPDPRLFLKACALIDVPAKACLYIGDGSSRELSGARGVGMSAVLIEANHGMHLDREENWDGQTITDLRGVLTLLDEVADGPSSSD